MPVSREEILPGGRPGVEKVLINNNEWQDFYCGFHVHELRFGWPDVLQPYKTLVAGTWGWLNLPIDFMFKFVKYEVHHTDGVPTATYPDGTPRQDHLNWAIKRTRELMNLQSDQMIIGGDTGRHEDLLWKAEEQYIYPPTNLKLGFQCGYTGDWVFPTLTVQVTY